MPSLWAPFQGSLCFLLVSSRSYPGHTGIVSVYCTAQLEDSRRDRELIRSRGCYIFVRCCGVGLYVFSTQYSYLVNSIKWEGSPLPASLLPRFVGSVDP